MINSFPRTKIPSFRSTKYKINGMRYKIRHFILNHLVNPKLLFKVLTHTLPHSGFRRGLNDIFALLGC